MFFTLVANGHHTSLSLGARFQYKESELYAFPSWNLDYGYRFFIGKSHWFLDPTFNGVCFPLTMNIECRGGYQFSHKIAVYGTVGVGVFTESIMKIDETLKPLFPKVGVGLSWGFHKYLSLIGSIDYFSGFFKNGSEVRHNVSGLIGLQLNSEGFYKND